MFVFNPFGFETVDHTQEPTALCAFGNDHLGRVGRGAADMADFRHVFDGVEDVDRVEAFAQEK